MPYTYSTQPGAITIPDAAHPTVTYIDDAGVPHFDSLYNNQNDFDTWTSRAVIANAGGTNPLTGLAYNRGDTGGFFKAYTDKSEMLGQQEAARQAAESDDGLFGGGNLLAIAAAVAAAYFSGGTSLAAESAVAATTDAWAIGETVGTSIAGSGFEAFAANYFSPAGADLASAFSSGFQTVDQIAAAAVASGGSAVPASIIPELALSQAAAGSSGFSFASALDFANQAKSVYSTANGLKSLAGGTDTKGLAAQAYRGGAVPSGLSGVIPTPAQVVHAAKAGMTEPAKPQASDFDTRTLLLVGAIGIGIFIFFKRK